MEAAKTDERPRGVMETITTDELQARWRAQQVPREHTAVKCPVCGTVQSFLDLQRAEDAATPEHLRAYFGPHPDDAKSESQFGFSCVGRYTGAGPHEPGKPAGSGCNWTLGGFFKAHRLEVLMPDGKREPFFEPATPEEAQAHMRAQQPA